MEEDYLSIIVCDPKVVDIQLVEEDYLSIIVCDPKVVDTTSGGRLSVYHSL